MKSEFQRKTLFMIILFCAVAGILIAPASASVTSWELSPASPSVGDVITISGKASSNEVIEVNISHNEIVPVSGNNYEYQINKLKIPKTISGGENVFTVNATGEKGVKVKDVNVRVKKFKWFTLHSNAVEGNASISESNIPSWMNYFVKIDGDIVANKETSGNNKYKTKSNSGQVKLTFETSYDAAKADSKGNFSFKYDTESLPAGNYTISVGVIEKEFTLSPEKEKGQKMKFKLW